jgi:ribosomal protein S18 acetylase RimI-like enzyme
VSVRNVLGKDAEAKMKIRKASKKDSKEYLDLRKENLNEYSKTIRKEIKISEKKIKQEFKEIFSDTKKNLIVLEKDKKLRGYFIGSLLINPWKEMGYLDDIFVQKNFRRNGFGTLLIKEFVKTLKSKKINTLRLGVNLKNKVALKMYNKIGFKITHYEMDKEI